MTTFQSRLFLIAVIVTQSILSFAQTVSVTKNVYAPGEKIVVNFSGFPGNSRDWISISEPGSEPGKYIVWQYLGSNRSGTVSFDGRNSGNYEIRGHYNDEPTIRARVSFRIGNADQNISARTTKTSYKPGEKITVQYSGLPGNSKDWIGLAAAGSADDKYIYWFYTDGKQSGSHEFPAIPEGSYEIRSYFNGDNIIRSRYPFRVSKTGGGDRAICRAGLSFFYAGMNALGLAWGRLGSDGLTPTTIAAVQGSLANAVSSLDSVSFCIDFDQNKIRSFSSRIPSLTREQAVNEIDQLIKELQGSIVRANMRCDNGASLHSLFVTGVHLGAAQAIANTFICTMIPVNWQTNVRNHMSTARDGFAGFSACAPSINLNVFNMVPVGAGNAYEPLSFIIGIHMQVLWAVSLTDCCCYCSR